MSSLVTEPPAEFLAHREHGPWRPPLAKILATIGPSIAHPDVVQRVIECGATLFRLNFSHGRLEDHGTRLRVIRDVAGRMETPVAVLGDLAGPKIRVVRVPDPGIVLRPGQDVEIRIGVTECVDGAVPILGATYDNVVTDVEPGHRVLINDGKIRMLCVSAESERLFCRVLNGGLVTTGKGINLPESELRVPALTERDAECGEWAGEHERDFVALSFVRTGDEVRELRARLARRCTADRCGTGLSETDLTPIIPVISKIETPQAVKHIDDIIVASDAIMVARGDLGVEMDLAVVPVIQKRIIQTAHGLGKPCIVATQMLESMIDSPTATRAEISDGAIATLDGADAVMLSAETAIGKYPHLAVETMRRVTVATEHALHDTPSEPRPPARIRAERQIIPALAHGAWHIAQDIGATVIVVWSQTGGSARFLSRNGFDVPIIAFSSDPRAVRRMCLLAGVYPHLVSEAPEHRSDFARWVDGFIIERGLVQPGDPVVLLGGKPLDAPGSLNTVAARYAGELARGE